MTLLLTAFDEDIGTITFNHEEPRNSRSNTMLMELIAAFHLFERQKARAVIIRANTGVKVWSSGLHINELPVPGRDPLSYNDPLEQALRAIQLFPAPVIAMIEGGVCDLSFICDIAIGCPTTTFAITPAKIGAPYNSTGILHFIDGCHTTSLRVPLTPTLYGSFRYRPETNPLGSDNQADADPFRLPRLVFLHSRSVGAAAITDSR
ncbi:MAG: hypothetical protein FIA91_08060 [Geobacter sp.]|nr:hypothetical protein [Geobacter sp.]